MKRLALLLALILSVSLVAGCSNSTSAATQKISPQNYVSEYVDGGETHLLVDVRTPQEFAEGHIAGSVNIPLQDLTARMSEIPKDTNAVIYCRSGNRSGQAMQILANAGYTKIYDLGGVIAWTGAGYPLQR